MAFVDTHAHLNFPDYRNDLETVVGRAKDAGVSHIVNIGISLKDSLESMEIADRFENIFFSVGIHPHNASDANVEKEFEGIRNIISNRHKRLIAIGEVGLDYYKNNADREDQKRLFIKFLKLHKETGLPMIIHGRESYDDIFRLIDSEGLRGKIKGVLHCFTADSDVAEKALSYGLHISFTGIITFKKSDSLRNVVAGIPDNRIMLETDAPFLAPQSVRGKRNEPSYIPEIADTVADVRGVSRDDIARITTLNFALLFNAADLIPSPSIVYKIRDSLYINVTSECSNECSFCAKFYDKYVKGYNLAIGRDPDVGEVLREIDSYKGGFKEVVFCGFGEPTVRLDFMTEVARALKEKGVYIRLNTNGQGNLINKKDILPLLKGLIDEVSISLNFQNGELYERFCRPKIKGENVYEAVKDFIRRAKEFIPVVVITALDTDDVDVEEMEKIAAELGVKYRQRNYNKVG